MIPVVSKRKMPPTRIIIHHSASTDHPAFDVQQLRKWHVEHNEWADIGYNYIIEKINGRYEVIAGRMLDEAGAHCVGNNTISIGICCVGNYEVDTPSEEMLDVLRRLVRSLMATFKIPRGEIYGHRDLWATACPGKNFNINEFVGSL